MKLATAALLIAAAHNPAAPGLLSSHRALLLSSSATPLAGASSGQVPEEVAAQARRIAGTLQLAAQEYRLAWREGRLASPAEWEEARRFVAEARRTAEGLPPVVRQQVHTRLSDLERRLERQMPPDSLAVQVGEIQHRLSTAIGLSLDERPQREPDIAAGELLYRSTCARCHGLGGRGDGPVARTREFTPPPANLADPALILRTTPLELYRKISLGVPGTRMPPFGEALSQDERWDLVSYLLTLSDSAARRRGSGSLALAFAETRGTLAAARAGALRGEADAAGREALGAYLAFEAVEGSLRATDPGLVRRAEAEFAAFRQAAAAGLNEPVLEAHYEKLSATLAEAEAALGRSRSAAGFLAESFLLVVREGFEAMLVIGAIMAALARAGASHRRRNVRWGIAAALVASVLTAALLEWLFRVTPAQREALEGGVMLLAALVLFYVSYWLISKVEVAAWTRFVKDRVARAVGNGSGLALGAVAFLAVYREGFETVLFCKALYVTGGALGAGLITAGLIAGLAALVAVFVAIERFGLRVPVRPFFAFTGATLALMALVFAGDSIKELQEGGYVASTLVPRGPRSEFFGVYPTWESLALQGLMLAAILGALIWTFALRPRTRAAPARSPDLPEGAGSPRAVASRSTEPPEQLIGA